MPELDGDAFALLVGTASIGAAFGSAITDGSLWPAIGFGLWTIFNVFVGAANFRTKTSR